MYAYDADLIRSRYNLPMLREVENYVAGLVMVDVPFNNYITGFTAFTHKAGIHAKAILNNPSTYEILKPEDFGLTRYIHVAHRLTGWNAIKERAEQLELHLSDDEIKNVTSQIKSLADEKRLTLDDVDVLLRQYHSQSVANQAIEAAGCAGGGAGLASGADQGEGRPHPSGDPGRARRAWRDCQL